MTLRDRLVHAWNAFRHPLERFDFSYGSWSGQRIDKKRLSNKTDRSIVAAMYNKIAIDVAANKINHIKLDEEGRFSEIVLSSLNYALNTSANLDQTSRSFIQDVTLSLFDEGVVAIVPVDTTFNPLDSESYDIKTLRAGEIVEWFPKHIKMRVYDENDGKKHELILPKSMVAIIENPLYSIMNEPNSTIQRLIRKLNLLDAIDEQSASGKLDLIVQLPYVIKSEARRQQAEERRKSIEDQLSGTKYGIAYIDGTERVTQLNRAVENNLMAQVEYLTKLLYDQLGLAEGVIDGSADEEVMLNYYSRTIAPVMNAICDELNRKFLTKTARTQGHTIRWFNDPFKLVPAAKLAEMADKFTRNEILSSNEIRSIIGYKPSSDPKADELRNKNIAAPNEEDKQQEPSKEEQRMLKEEKKSKTLNRTLKIQNGIKSKEKKHGKQKKV